MLPFGGLEKDVPALHFSGCEAHPVENCSLRAKSEAPQVSQARGSLDLGRGWEDGTWGATEVEPQAEAELTPRETRRGNRPRRQ